MTSELLRANQHIQMLSSYTGHKAETFGEGILQGKQLPNNNITIHNNYNQNVVAYIGKP